MKKIVLIEDDKFVREDVVRLLEFEGFSAFGFATGADGLKGIKKLQPDLVICDIMLPDHDGYAVLKALQKNDKISGIPFIFLTAKAEMSDLRRGMSLGADDYLVKPFDPEDLIKTIKIRLRKQELATSSEPQSIKIENSNSPAINLDSCIFVRGKEEYYPIKISEIEFISAEDIYTVLHIVNGKSILVKRKMKDWEELLPSQFFIRIHKSTIINLTSIVKIEKWFNRSYKVKLKHNNNSLIISKRFALKNKITELLIN